MTRTFGISFIFALTVIITNTNAQVKVTSSGKMGIGNSSPLRKLQVGSANSTDYSAWLKLHGNFNYNDWQDHARIEFNDGKWGIGVGDLDATSSTKHGMYFFTYSIGGTDG